MSLVSLYENPAYTKSKENDELYCKLYEGDQKELKNPAYLWKHELEMKSQGNNLRLVREQRSAYTNWAEVLVSIWTSVMFRKDPLIPDEVKDLLGDYEQDIDGEGTSLTSFIRDHVVKNNFIYGKPIVKVNTLGQKPETLKDEKTNTSYRPYFECISPKMFIDWDIEKADVARLNKFNWVRLEYCEYKPRKSALDAPQVTVVSKVYIIEEAGLHILKYELSGEEDRDKKDKEKKWRFVDEDFLPEWDEIPISANLNGESWLKDVAPHILKYYNTESVLDNIVLFQAHQRCFFIGDFQNEERITIAEHAFNTLPAGSNVTVIPPTDLNGPEQRLGKILATIFRIGLNQLKIQSEGLQVERAETMQEQKDTAVALIQAEVESIENIINNAIRLWAKYLGNDDFVSEIKFDVEDIKSNIDNAVKLVMVFRDEVAKLPRMRKELLNWFVEEMNLASPDELKEEIAEMIEATGDEATQQALEAEIRANIVNQALEARNGNAQEPK